MTLPAPYYDQDGITIYHGDCRQVMPFLPTADLVLTDPPYGANTHEMAKSNKGAGHGTNVIDFAPITLDDLSEVLQECAKKCERWIVATMEWRHVAKFEAEPPTGLRFMRFGVWVKTDPMPQISADRPGQGWEAIAYMHNATNKPQWNGGGRSGNFVAGVCRDGFHPTGKPLKMFRQLVTWFSSPDETILDPFMGSGTTLVAAKLEGRSAVGIEINEAYCEAAANRLSQGVLFGAEA